MTRIAKIAAACALVLISSLGEGQQSPPGAREHLDTIEKLVTKSGHGLLTTGEAQLLSDTAAALKEFPDAKLPSGVSVEDAEKAYGKALKAVDKDTYKKAVQQLGYRSARLSTGKEFAAKGFTRSSDYDGIVSSSSTEKSQKIINAYHEIAPKGFAQNFGVQLYTSDTFYTNKAYAKMDAGQFARAEERLFGTLSKRASVGAGYLSDSGVAANYQKYMPGGKYASNEFVSLDKKGGVISKAHPSQHGTLAFGFGQKPDKVLGDALAVSSENLYQLDNYVASKGPVEGTLKGLERQMEVLKNLGPGEVQLFEKKFGVTVSQIEQWTKLPKSGMESLVKSGQLKLGDVKGMIHGVNELAGSGVSSSGLSHLDTDNLKMRGNLASVIANAGGKDPFLKMHGGNSKLAATVESLFRNDSFKDKVATLTLDREAAKKIGLQEMAQLAQRQEQLLEAVAKGSPSMAARFRGLIGAIPPSALKGTMAALEDAFLGLEAAKTGYHLSKGEYMKAFGNSADFFAMSALSKIMDPGAMLKGAGTSLVAGIASSLVANSCGAFMQWYFDGIGDARLNDAWQLIAGNDPGDPAFLQRLLEAEDSAAMGKLVNDLWLDSSKFSNLVGMDSNAEKQLRATLAAKLMDFQPELRKKHKEEQDKADYLFVVMKLAEEKEKKVREAEEAIEKDAALPPVVTIVAPLAADPESVFDVSLQIDGGEPPFSCEGAFDGSTSKRRSVVKHVAPKETGEHRIAVTVTDANGKSDASELVIEIRPKLTLKVVAPPIAAPGEEVMVTLLIEGGTPLYAVKLAVSGIPEPMEFGETKEAKIGFKHTVMDREGSEKLVFFVLDQLDTQAKAVHEFKVMNMQILVAGPASLTPNAEAQLEIEILGGEPPYFTRVDGASFSGESATLETETGTFPFRAAPVACKDKITVTVRDNKGKTASASHSFVVGDFAVSVHAPDSAGPGEKVPVRVEVNGGQAPYTVRIGRIETKFSASPGQAEFQAPREGGTYEIEVEVEDANQTLVIQRIRLDVGAFEVRLRGPSKLKPSEEADIDIVFDGGEPPYVVRLAGSELRFEASRGRFTIKAPSADGVHVVTAGVSDRAGNTALASFSYRVESDQTAKPSAPASEKRSDCIGRPCGTFQVHVGDNVETHWRPCENPEHQGPTLEDIPLDLK